MSTLMPEEHKEIFRKQFEWHLAMGRKITLMFEKEKRYAESLAAGKTREEDPQAFEWIERYEGLLLRCKEGEDRIKIAIEQLR